jgi:hypothetical protein
MGVVIFKPFLLPRRPYIKNTHVNNIGKLAKFCIAKGWLFNFKIQRRKILSWNAIRITLSFRHVVHLGSVLGPHEERPQQLGRRRQLRLELDRRQSGAGRAIQQQGHFERFKGFLNILFLLKPFIFLN